MKINIAPVYLKREGSIEGRYAYCLGSDELYNLYKKIEFVEQELDIQKKLITEELSLIIQVQESDDDRKILINLKRNIFNLRKNFLKSVEKNHDLIMKNGMKDKIDQFVKMFLDWDELKNTYRELYVKEEKLERERLVDAYKENEDVLAKAMKFIHPSTLQKLKKYTNIPANMHKAKERKCDDTVAKVITRAAHKTSPFSTFTHVGAGIMGEDIGGISSSKYTTVTKFNIVYALRIYEKVILLPEIMEQSTYKFADTLVYLRGKFYWTVLADAPDKRKKVYKTVDELITVNGNAILESVYYEFLPKKEFTFKQLHQFLINKKLSDEKAKQLLITLVQKQFFCNVKFLDQNSNNIIGEFIEILEEYTKDIIISQISDLLNRLRIINREIITFDGKDAVYQLKSLDKIADICREITTEYEIGEFDEKQILYMDSILNHIKMLDVQKWEKIFQSMSIFQEFAKVFDISYRFQLMLGRKFYEMFGTEKVSIKEKEHIILDTLLTNLIANIDLWDNQLRVSSQYFDISELKKLEELKNDFLQFLFENMEKQQIDFSSEKLQDYINELPGLVKKQPQSNSFFMQDTGKNNLKVLNDFYAGHMVFLARFIRNMPFVYENGKFQDYIKTTMWDENIADMYLMYGFNANRRKNLTKKAISLPNNRVIDNRKEQFEEVVDLHDLYMQYDMIEKRIKLYQGEEEIKPQFLGTLVTTLLPSVTAMIHLLNFNVVLLQDIGYSMILHFLDQKEDFKIKEFPRIVMDGQVVMSRRRWLVNTDYMENIKNAKDNELVEQTLAFIQENNFPRRIFVSKFFYKNEGLNSSDDNTDKPMFMDMSSPVLVVLLKKNIMNTKYIIMEEVLPDLSNNDKETYVSEYIFEISQTNER